MLTNDTETASDLYNRILFLLQKLPQYNPDDFNFKIFPGEPPDLKLYYNGGCYYVENGVFYSCNFDHGNMNKKSKTDLEAAIYSVLFDLTQEYACKYEIKHRIKYVDSRRQWMEKWQELFDIIGMPYNNKFNKFLSEIFRKYPYDDANTCKLELFKEYEEIAALLKKTVHYKNIELQKIIDKMLSAYRDEHGGIPDFDNSFNEMRKSINAIESFLKNVRNSNKVNIILQLIYHTESIAEKYIK